MYDNIDLGKTHEYFKWVAKHYGGEGKVKGRPRFVVYVIQSQRIGQSMVMMLIIRKADDDVCPSSSLYI